MRWLLLCLAACGGPGLTPRTPPPAGPSVPNPAPKPLPAAAQTYQDPEGLFTVSFRVPFDVDTAKEPLGGGTMTTTSVASKTPDPLFMVVKLALADITTYDCTKGLDGMRDESMSRAGCKADNEKRFELKSAPAREITFTCKNNRRGVMVLACDASKQVTGKRITAYEVVASGATMSEDDARQFTSSFQLREP